MNALMKKANGNGNVPATTFSGMVDKIFQNSLNRLFDDQFWGLNSLERTVNVPVNIRQADNRYELELIAPGLKKENFKINVNGEVLTVSFEHRDEQSQQNKEESWLRKEYRLQAFTRSFNLDDTIDANKIEASYRDGVLHLRLPIKEGAQLISRTIQIS